MMINVVTYHSILVGGEKIMIEIEKYLYWMDAKPIDLENEIVYREMYSRIGFIFHIIQMIEYNIANILALEEFEKKQSDTFTYSDVQLIKNNIDIKFSKLSKLTFGRLKDEVEKSKYLANVDMELLKKIVDYRNYLAHRCFKEKLLNNELSSVEDADKFVDELNNFETVSKNFNEWLLTVFRKNRIKRIVLIR